MPPWEKYQKSEKAAFAEKDGKSGNPWEKYQGAEQQEKDVGYLGNVGKYFTEDVPAALGGAYQRTADRTQRIEAPTDLGQLGQKVLGTGTEGPAATAVEAVAGLPERATRTVLGAFGTLGEVAAVPSELVMKGINRWLGNKPGDLLQSAISKGVNSEPGKKVIEAATGWWDSLEESEKANYGSMPDALDMIGFKVGKGAPIKFKDELGDVIEKGISKGIKPTVVNKQSFSKMKGFYNKADDAVRTLKEYRDVVNLVDDAGEAIPYPKNAAQMAKAIEETKKQVYKEYHNLALKSGDAGAQFKTKNIADKLETIISGPKSKGKSPSLRKYAQRVKKEIVELEGAAPEIIEERIKELNSSLAPAYASRFDKGTAQIDGSVANAMREEINNLITKSTGKGYKDLKKKYGSLLAIEKEVNKRAIVNARKADAGIADLTDVFSNANLASGLLTMNPALLAKGTAGKVTKDWIKKINDPDKKIADMFKAVYESKPRVRLADKDVGNLGSLSRTLTEDIRPAPIVKSTFRSLNDDKQNIRSGGGRRF